ncbi:hypothetical protein ACHAXH_004624 [Discostella pseudostelligera]
MMHAPSTTSNNTTTEELQRIQKECASMIQTLKELHDEEMQLRASNKFLAHRAAVMGCTGGLDGGTRREARRKAAAKKAAATTSGSGGGGSSQNCSIITTPNKGERIR